MDNNILTEKEPSNLAYSHIIHAPIEKVDIAGWLFACPKLSTVAAVHLTTSPVRLRRLRPAHSGFVSQLLEEMYEFPSRVYTNSLECWRWTFRCGEDRYCQQNKRRSNERSEGRQSK
jgi:hypothetical protein